MFSFVFPEKCSLSGRIGSHNHVAEIYSISANAVICVFSSVILYSSAEIASFSVTYVNDGFVFVRELIGTRLLGDVLCNFFRNYSPKSWAPPKLQWRNLAAPL